MSCPVCHGLNVQFSFETQWGGGSVFELKQLAKFVDKKLWKLFYLGKTWEEANKENPEPKEIDLDDLQ